MARWPPCATEMKPPGHTVSLFFGALLIRLERRMNERGDKQPEQNRRDHQRERENHRDPSAIPD